MSVVQFNLDQPELEFTASGGSTVRRTVLPSGVRVLTESMPSAQSASVSFAVAVGSRDEVDGFISTLMGDGTNGFWDITPNTLDQISEDIASKFDFTVAQAAE